MIYHGVYTTSTGTVYSLGAAMLDADDPSRVVGKTRSPILMPVTDYERLGLVNNVVFSGGHVVVPEQDEIRVYYGCADTCIGMAVGRISELVQACREGA